MFTLPPKFPIQLFQGSCLDVLRRLDPCSIDCFITEAPKQALRFRGNDRCAKHQAGAHADRIHFPSAKRRRRLSKGAEVYVLRSGPSLRIFHRHRFTTNSALLRLFLDDAEVHDNPNAGAVIAVEVTQ